jgi:hypothetical protein
MKPGFPEFLVPGPHLLVSSKCSSLSKSLMVNFTPSPIFAFRLTRLILFRYSLTARNSLGMCPRRWHLILNNDHHRCPCTFSESCIKGHRSSSCSHTERPLYEIKKKGRPISQCERCRQLRNTKKMHSKCTCSEGSSSSQTREATDRVFGTKRQPFPSL